MGRKALGFLNVPVFCVAFAIAALVVYLMAPEKKVVWLYPSRSGEYQYKNANQKCFDPAFEGADCTIFAKNVGEN
tara:strand:+ start:316 stop:540 length:225 start_codon:yes stop_codon:yes gene_type:complete